jgi:hypothetical protein
VPGQKSHLLVKSRSPGRQGLARGAFRAHRDSEPRVVFLSSYHHITGTGVLSQHPGVMSAAPENERIILIMRWSNKVISIAVAVVAVVGTSTAALALSGNPKDSAPGAAAKAATATGSGGLHGCVYKAQNRTLEHVYRGDKGLSCPKGSFYVNLAGPGPQGPAGPRGPQGPAGPRGPRGPVSSNGSLASTWTPTAVTLPATVNTGGSFTSGKTALGTLTLQPGKYLLNVNFMATPDETTGGNVFPSLYVYNGVQLSDFSNDLFNAGSGALEDPTPLEITGGDLIDSYFSGSGIVTVTGSPETLDIYAFGYDSDQGGGQYTLDAASISAVQVGS